MPVMPFRQRLELAWERTGTTLCAGVEPRIEAIPACFGRGPGAVRAWGRALIAAAGPHAAALKFQIAHFAAIGAEPDLEGLLADARSAFPDRLLILDAKRSDIGSTAEYYAREAFERYGADAVTVNPYLGSDAVEPFLRWPDRGTLVLCHTSNPGAGEFQGTPPEGGTPLYERVALAARRWNGAGNVMLVVGATHPQALRRVRALAPELALLVPGVGAQGGDPGTVLAAGADASGRGLLVNVSRGLLPHFDGTGVTEADYRARVAEGCRRYADALAFPAPSSAPRPESRPSPAQR